MGSYALGFWWIAAEDGWDISEIEIGWYPNRNPQKKYDTCSADWKRD